MSNILLSKTPEYNAWVRMKDRCYNKKCKQYNDYGGRGITVCEKWLFNSSNFLNDMGLRPSQYHSLDRIDNSKGYSPENCKWSTRQEQNNNRRKLRNNTSGYVGVSFDKYAVHKPWGVNISLNNVRHKLGRYATPEEAALQYDKAVIFFRDINATTNFL